MKYFSDEQWGKLPIDDWRPRFFVEIFMEKLSIDTPHFYQSRLMSIFTSCAEALTYINEYTNNDKNGGYILSAIDEIESCWSNDAIAQTLFVSIVEPRKQLFKKIRQGELSAICLNRLSVICRAILSREEEYTTALLLALQKELTGTQNLQNLDRITVTIHALTSLYTTHLLNKGYSPTYLFNRVEMFIRGNNYAGRSFEEQFLFVTEKLRNQNIAFEVYYALRVSKPKAFLEIQDDPDFSFFDVIPDYITGQYLEKLKKDDPQVIAKSLIESTDYVSAGWRVKEKLDKLLDAITALELNPRIKISSNCVVINRSGQTIHTKSLSIDLLINFLSSEGGTHFSSSESSIRHALATLDVGGKEHLGRSLRYLRLARESVSLEQKILNLWIALESLFSDGENSILANILEYVPQMYAVSGLKRRVSYFKHLLVVNKIRTTPQFQSRVAQGVALFDKHTTDAQIFGLLRDEAAAIELFNSLEQKEHLKFRLMSIFKELKNNDTISERIKRTEVDVTRQLRRIYFLRNKMTHTGHFANIRPQLVSHLLDYVAISYAAISASANQAKLKNTHSIGDMLAANKMGCDVVISGCHAKKAIIKIEELIPMPII